MSSKTETTGVWSLTDATSNGSGGRRHNDGSWRERALCAETDPETFFPEKGDNATAAKAICIRCDVREQCLAEALERDERFGIWGGLSRSERREISARQSV